MTMSTTSVGAHLYIPMRLRLMEMITLDYVTWTSHVLLQPLSAPSKTNPLTPLPLHSRPLLLHEACCSTRAHTCDPDSMFPPQQIWQGWIHHPCHAPHLHLLFKKMLFIANCLEWFNPCEHTSPSWLYLVPICGMSAAYLDCRISQPTSVCQTYMLSANYCLLTVQMLYNE